MKNSKILALGLLLFAVGCSNEVDPPPPDPTEGSYKVTISANQKLQTIEGFGASLAYYENWLTAHPNKAEIYEAIFGELGLDILRVRNAHGYDEGMVARVAEFAIAAETSLGKPIQIMTTSWGPPADLKSNNDRANGGTLRYTKDAQGVHFDYEGFANWWKESLEAYNASGVYPDYISIQNEPDYTTDYESCRLDPAEKITTNDTIAGYNNALDAVYQMIQTRGGNTKILGPETVGIGYNNVENYTSVITMSQLDALAHHLYHGVDPDDPFGAADFTKVGNNYPGIPHFQTEYYRGDWFATASIMYRSFYDENIAAYLYWDLIWGEEGGLVTLDFPWDTSRWIDPAKGYTKNKEFFAFKQYSAFIHEGWQRIAAGPQSDNIKSLAFINPDETMATAVFINASDTRSEKILIEMPGYTITNATIYRTSATENCETIGPLDAVVILPPHTVTTVQLNISK